MEFETQLNELLEGVKAISEKESVHADEVKEIKEKAETFEASFKELKEKSEQSESQVIELKEAVAELEDSIETLSAKSNRPQLFGKESEMEAKEINVKETNQFLKETIINAKSFEYEGAEGELKVKAGNMNVTNDAEGKVAIVEDMERQILKRLLDDYAILNVVGSRTLSSPEFKRLVDAQRAGARWVGENTAAAAPQFTQTPTLQFIRPVLGKVQAYSFITDEAQEDPAVDLKSYMVTDIADQMGRAISESLWRGDGANKPKGILEHFDDVESVKPDEGAGARSVEHFAHRVTSTQGKLASGTGSTLSQNIIDFLIDTVYALKTGYRANARWMFNRKTFAELAKLKDAEGRYYLTKDVSEGSDGTLLGFPVTIDDYADDIEAGKYPILFGDFKRGYEFINYRGMKTLQDNVTAPGVTKVYFDRRVGSMIGDNKAVIGIKVKAA
ncbi:Phage major capsid protein [Photobacterium marinum]|uniref:Phage major capsid protein n=1 Tax=Photobacterium marinum TaxID=1056511 RepID=L8JF59_9GAMM|nr:phage major capsid protein [Photobacterium marinum]ELR66057.1 Phage major capsid protein [Photobacterium marinum]